MNTDDDDIIDDNYTWVKFKFKSIRLVGGVFTCHNSKIKAELIMGDGITEQEIDIALEKMHFWFDHIMPISLLFSRDNEKAFELLCDEEGKFQVSNFPMIMPGDPSDDMLAIVLHSKLNAFAGDNMMVGTLEIESDTKESLSFMYTGYGEHELPSIDEWVGERSYHKAPWWARNDGSTLDIVPGEDSDLSDPPFVGVDLSYIDQRFEKIHNPTVVIRPEKFEPKIITGGKDDTKKD